MCKTCSICGTIILVWKGFNNDKLEKNGLNIIEFSMYDADSLRFQILIYLFWKLLVLSCILYEKIDVSF